MTKVQVQIQMLWGSPFATTKARHTLMHIVKLLQTWLIDTEVEVIICLSQGGPCFPSALSIYNVLSCHDKVKQEQDNVASNQHIRQSQGLIIFQTHHTVVLYHDCPNIYLAYHGINISVITYT